jgi:NAD(P)-dependent dehydrogenase (short-subunit alcohol dehydrogenase family)
MRLIGKTALVTGAANGIGAAIARLFALQGARVMVTDADGAGADVVARAIVAAGGEARSLALDVTEAADWDAAIAATTEAFGGLTTLINNAGIFHPGGIEHETIAGWDRVIAINQTSILRGMQAALPLLLASGKGSIVNLSSLYGLVGSPNAFSYHASKAAVRHMGKAAALEFARKGVRVNTILPGQIQTAMFASITPEQAAAIAEATPMGHVGEPDDIAFGAVYLASDEAKFVTGIDLVIDGGWAAG